MLRTWAHSHICWLKSAVKYSNCLESTPPRCCWDRLYSISNSPAYLGVQLEVWNGPKVWQKKQFTHLNNSVKATQTRILSQHRLNIYTKWHFRVLLCVFDLLICRSATSTSRAHSLGQKLLVSPALNKVKRWHHRFTDFQDFLVETIRWKIVRFWCIQLIAFAGGTGRR